LGGGGGGGQFERSRCNFVMFSEDPSGIIAFVFYGLVVLIETI